MRILVTGANGFLGWHTRLRLAAERTHEVITVTRENWPELGELLPYVDAVIHLAGVNRAASDRDVEEGNVQLAVELAASIASTTKPLKVVMSGTIHDEKDTPYGRGKRRARDLLSEATHASGGHFVSVCLPNLFGEHAVPHYNSFVATFIDCTISGEVPVVNDNLVELLHAQDAAQAIIEALDSRQDLTRPKGEQHRVASVWGLLQEIHGAYYPVGEFPDLSSKFRIDMFNSYRAALFPDHYPISLVPHSDSRGSFVETVRCRGGEGQSSFSSTAVDVTRGDHYHLSKVERFAVIRGEARISIRRMFHERIYDFYVSGDAPVAIDMPVGWVHNITNIGDDVLFTQFWSHDLFRPEAPDTYTEPVRAVRGELF